MGRRERIMIYKCDSCKNQVIDTEGARCNKKHWYGLGYDDDESDVYNNEWDDCEDYVSDTV